VCSDFVLCCQNALPVSCSMTISRIYSTPRKAVSKSQTQRTIQMISNLSKDIADNMLSGNEHRAMLYLKAQRCTLDALLAKLESGNDVRAEQALDAAMKEINTTMDKDHKGVPFNREVMEAGFERWENWA
jgi:hypothetical protein